MGLPSQVSSGRRLPQRRATDHPPRPVTEPDSSTHELEERSPAYLRLLLCLLLPAAMFNAYDAELRAVLLTQLKASFHVGTAAIGLANIPIGVGQFVAFFVVLQADRIGRRPILLWSIAGYTVFTTLTAVSWSIWSFAAFQFAAQVFIGAEFGVAVILLAEEVPAEQRGRYLSWLLLVSPLGAVLAGSLVAVGFLHNPLGWRAFFLIAALPLLVVSVARRRLRESRVYLDMARRHPAHPTLTIRQRFVAGSTIWRGRDRGHAMAVSAIALLQGLVSAGAVGWWTYYAEHERHFSTTTAGAFFATAALFSVGGYVLAGYLMDRIGRRPTAVIYVDRGRFLRRRHLPGQHPLGDAAVPRGYGILRYRDWPGPLCVRHRAVPDRSPGSGLGMDPKRLR